MDHYRNGKLCTCRSCRPPRHWLRRSARQGGNLLVRGTQYGEEPLIRTHCGRQRWPANQGSKMAFEANVGACQAMPLRWPHPSCGGGASSLIGREPRRRHQRPVAPSKQRCSLAKQPSEAAGAQTGGKGGHDAMES